MKNIILCVTHSGDYYTIDLVQHALAERGYRSLRFNTDTFPYETQISYRTGSAGSNATIVQGDITVNSEEIGAVWLRKIASSVIPLDEEEGHQHPFHQQCIAESEAAKSLYFCGLENIPWIDELSRIKRGEDKGLQLRAATEAGLTIPDTLITNKPDDVLAFYHRHDGKIVTKMLTPLTVSMGRPNQFVYTSRVTQEHLNQLDGLRYSPMVFQTEIPKAYELRVTYVAGECFCGKVVTHSASDKTQVDWRQAQPGECQWEKHTLPSREKDAIHKMMRSLDLDYGAIDLIVTPDNDIVFLEVNPCGEWGMLQKTLNLPIAEAIANALIAKIQSAETANKTPFSKEIPA